MPSSQHTRSAAVPMSHHFASLLISLALSTTLTEAATVFVIAKLLKGMAGGSSTTAIVSIYVLPLVFLFSTTAVRQT